MDIYIPSLRIAIEIGTWFFHRNRLWNDQKKDAICLENHIQLFVFYTEYSEESTPDLLHNCTTTPFKIDSSRNIDLLQKYVMDLFYECGINRTFLPEEWHKIYKKAYLQARRKTTKVFSEQLALINPQIEVIGEYKNSATKIKVKCNKCDYLWESTPSNLLQGYGCPNCAGMTRTTESFKKEIENINPNIQVLGEYKNNKTKVRCECKICGNNWFAIPSSLLRGSGCSSCARKRRTLSTLEFENRVKQKNEDIEIIGDYVNSYTEVCCRCKKCGNVWNPKASSLLAGTKCPKCRNKKK